MRQVIQVGDVKDLPPVNNISLLGEQCVDTYLIEDSINGEIQTLFVLQACFQRFPKFVVGMDILLLKSNGVLVELVEFIVQDLR